MEKIIQRPRPICLLLSVFFLLLVTKTVFAKGSSYWDKVKVGRLERRFLVHLPPGFRHHPDNRVPLILFFHGGAGTPRGAEVQTGLSQLADREGVIIVYPEALQMNWNDGRNCHKIWSQANNIDDVGYVEALLAKMKSTFAIDEARVYAGGFSNGGMMCHLLAAKLPLAFAAVAVVGGGMAEGVAKNFLPDFPVSILVIHGTKDPVVPYRGGGVGYRHNRGRIIDNHRLVRLWRGANGCDRVPHVAYLPDRRRDGTRVKTFTYRNGGRGSEVVLYTIIGGGHVWPGKKISKRWRQMVGPVCLDFDGARALWSFFLSHPRKGVKTRPKAQRKRRKRSRGGGGL